MSIMGGLIGEARRYTEKQLEQALEAHPANRVSDIRMKTRVVACSDAVLFVQDIPGKVGHAEIHDINAGGLLATLGIFKSNAGGELKLPVDALLREHCSTNWEGLENLEGEYVAVAYCRHERTLHIVNDRFAARPFYVTFHDGTLFFCSSLSFLTTLARIPVSLDPLGCLSIGACGHLISDLSPVNKVTKLPPASHITASDGKINRKRYWKLTREVQLVDARRHAQRTFAAFEDSTRWRCGLSDSGLIALSGGMDSRLLAAVASRHACYRAFTFVDSDAAVRTLETECASQVASRLGIPHDIRRLSIDSLADDVRDVSLLVDGSVPIHHPLKVLSMIRASSDAGKYLMGGAPGDLSAGSKIPGLDYLDPERKEILSTSFRERLISPRSVLSEYFRPNVLDEYYPQLESLVSETLGSYDVSTAAESVTLWSMEHRWPHFQFTSPIHNHPLVSESSPFLGYGYNDCLLAIPAEWLYQKNFYFFMIYQSLPQLRDIVYANTGKPLDGRLYKHSRPNIARRAARHARRQVGSLRSLITKKKAKAGPKAIRYEGHVLRSDPRLLDEVRGIFENSPALAEIYDIQKCLGQLEKFERDGDLGLKPNKSLEVLGALITQAFYLQELT